MRNLTSLLLIFIIIPITVLAQIKTKDNVTFTIDAIPTLTVQGFYSGQGFSQNQIKAYTKTCVFTVTLKNNNKNEQINFKRTNWYASYKKKKIYVKDTKYWMDIFKKEKITMAQKIGFKFAQIPDFQTYEPNGDWNRGMLSINVPHKSTFDFTINWNIKGKQHELTIKKINCAQ